MTKVLLGFTVPQGRPFHIPMHHIVISGMTQLSGKSTTAETILTRGEAKALVFLTKRGEKIFHGGQRIPPYYRERFDWEYVRGLLEAAWHERLKFETPWIIRISKKSHSLNEFRTILGRMLAREKLREFDRNVYILLAAYLDKVLPVLEEAREQFVDRLELKPGINVMDLTPWYTHEEVQMLVIRSCMEHILKEENGVIVALPEAWKMLPQSRNTPVKLYFEKFIREGATNDNYLIIDAQDLGGVDKAPLRQVSVWIMGKMMEANEVERLLKQTLGLKVKAERIQTLPLGHFMVAYGKGVEEVYVWANGVPEDVARKVARGELTPEFVRDRYLKVKKEDEDLYKEKYEKEKREWEEERKELQREFLERLTTAEKKIEELEQQNMALREQNEEMRKANLDRYHGELKQANEKIEKLRGVIKTQAKAATEHQQKAESFDRICDTLRPFIVMEAPPYGAPGFESGPPSELQVATEQPALTVNVLRKPIIVSQDDLLGRIAIVYAEDLLPSKKAFTLRHLNQVMEQRFGRKEAYPNYGKPLTKLVAWGFFEKVKAGTRWDYRVKMPSYEAKKKGLLKIGNNHS